VDENKAVRSELFLI